jgi:hypothetical protein
VPGIPANRSFLLSLTALSLGACGGGGGNDNGGFVDPPPGTPVTVSGTVSYEFVPPNAGCSGLNFSATIVRPVRGATVVMLNSSDGEMARTIASETGAYSFANVAPDTQVRIRVLAELKASGTASWDVEVRDNFDTSPTAPPLASRPLYSMESSLFSTGSNDVTRNLTAETGWNAGSNSYDNPRVAGPFAILDTIYTGLQFIVAEDPDINLGAMDAFWSVNNTTATGDLPLYDPNDVDAIDSGELGGSFYLFGANWLFITGDANGDTDEFDAHVVGHEWVHFLDDTIFRSDNPGGTHRIGERADSRLAFAEGWPTALAAMFLDDPSYCESGIPGTNAGFEINAEAGFFGGQGWFDEVGMIRLIYDLWDTDAPGSDGTDNGSIGFSPIYEVMTGGLRSSAGWTNIFTFASELRPLLDANGAALLDSQLGDEQTVQGTQMDMWGTNETNDGGAINADEVLPIYVDMVPDGGPTNICSNSQFDLGATKDGNKLSEYRYIRLDVPMDDEYHVIIRSTTPTPDTNDHDSSDPDMFIIRDGVSISLSNLTSGTANLETTDPLLDPSRVDQPWVQDGPIFMSTGTYVADIRDWRYADPDIDVGYPSEVCFDVQFISTP